MVAVDTNILVYAHRREAREHEVARDTLRALVEGEDSWAIPWPCIYEFYSVVTNSKIWKDLATTPVQAVAQMQAWTSSPSLRLIGETEEFLPILTALLRPSVKGPMVHDARIAAICIAHSVEALLTRDRDFSRFNDLVVRNPLK